jgi:hypothetical protein
MSMVITAASSAVATLLFAAVAQVFGEHTLTNQHLWTIVVVVSLVNGLVSPLVLWACRWAEGTEVRAALGLTAVGRD